MNHADNEGLLNQVRLLSNQLLALEKNIRDMMERTDESDSDWVGHKDSYQRASYVMELRRTLRDFMDGSIFADPAFDMLLYLYVSAALARRVTTTDCCAASMQPRTTALRWIKTLVTKGLVVSEEDDSDARVTILSLAPATYQSMSQWLTAMQCTK